MNECVLKTTTTTTKNPLSIHTHACMKKSTRPLAVDGTRTWPTMTISSPVGRNQHLHGWLSAQLCGKCAVYKFMATVQGYCLGLPFIPCNIHTFLLSLLKKIQCDPKCSLKRSSIRSLPSKKGFKTNWNQMECVAACPIVHPPFPFLNMFLYIKKHLSLSLCLSLSLSLSLKDRFFPCVRCG